MKMKKMILAIPAAAPAIPPNPSAAAISAIISSDMTRPNIGLFSVAPSSTRMRAAEFRNVGQQDSFLDLIEIVFGREEEERRHGDNGKDRINSQFGALNCSRKLLTEVVELIEK